MVVTKETNIETGVVTFTLKSTAPEMRQFLSGKIVMPTNWEHSEIDPIPDEILYKAITYLIGKK